MRRFGAHRLMVGLTVGLMAVLVLWLLGCGPDMRLEAAGRAPFSLPAPDDTGQLLPGDSVNEVATATLPVAATPGQQIVQVAKAELNKYASAIGTGVTSYPYDLGRYLYSGEAYCSEFVAWVYKVAGYPLTGGSETGGWMFKSAPALVSWHKSHAQYIARGSAGWSSYTPQPGDYIYFVWSSGSSHSGIVDHVEGVDLKTVEGNVNQKVLALTRKDWRNYSSIKGFGVRQLGPAPAPDAGPPPPPKKDSGTPPPPPPNKDASAPSPHNDAGTQPPPVHDTGAPGPHQDQGGGADAMQIIRRDGGASPPGLNPDDDALIGGCSVTPAGGVPWPLVLLLLLAVRRMGTGSAS